MIELVLPKILYIIILYLYFQSSTFAHQCNYTYIILKDDDIKINLKAFLRHGFNV